MQERVYGNWVHHHPFKIPFCRTELWQLQQENLVQDLRVFTHDVLTKKAATIYGSQSSVVGHPCAEDRCDIQTEWRVHVGLQRDIINRRGTLRWLDTSPTVTMDDRVVVAKE
ncbi:hypothetical protein RUM43_013706 [Polyplax serrata]|uniref:Uncharacterized protein n=1 Tax=Polyplax serrata TaxID=468196 RepID=A0AAN8RZ15_POLSC